MITRKMWRAKFAITSILFLTTITLAADTTTPAPSLDFRFTRALYNVTIPENSVLKTYATPDPGEERIGIPLPDGHNLGELRFKITSGDIYRFFRAEERIVGDFCFLFIRTRTGQNDVLNRERKDKYELEVRATATKREGKYKYVLEADSVVRVKILDTNDLNPLFFPTEYQALVPEDTPVHQKIVQVFAEDADLGRNGEIYYSFLDETDQFAIHPITGIVSLTRPLKFTDGSYHELVVVGQDRGTSSRSGASQSSRARVKIRVKQVNLYPPEIRVHRLPHIVENSNADIYAIVNVSDKDSGIHGEIGTLEIVDGDPDGHFRIRPTQQKGEFNIEVLKLLDRETTPQGYQLKLRAVDKGTPPRESYKSVPVQLTDLNDNAPIFSKEIYDVKVSETVPINTPLIRLKVTDKDEGKNAQVYLEIVGGNEGGEFHVNPDTGVLYTAVKLDYEAKNFYSLTVSAIDQGNTGTRKQSSAKVKIYVVDTNDNDPVFERSDMEVWINENEPPGTSVTKVTAKDRDSGENAYISYSIVNLKSVPFEIDPFSGVVKTTQLIDYESMRREYVLRLRASDWGLPYRRQTEMQLTIKIKDINDNRPQFEKIDCTGHVPRYVPIGSEIITLSAIDFDAGNIISYRIVSGNDDGCFTVDATSGTLSVSCDLNELRVNERIVNVTATDGTHFADIVSVHFFLVNAKRNSALTGRILSDEMGAFDCKDTGVARRLTEVLAAAERNNDENHSREDFLMMPTRYGQNIHTPEFLEFPIEIKVNESVALGTTLVKIKARDRDLGYNGKLIYGISGGDADSVFCLDTDTGELKIIGYLDRERESEYYLNITVYDLGKPQKAASKLLPITVLDVNDNAPKFEKSLAAFRVTENALNGTAIFRANATDADTGENAKITYSLETDTHDFMVDPATGVLFVCNTLDRERQDLYELRIRATDSGGRSVDTVSLHSEALVRITVDDINDNAPRFSLPSYSVKIREDVPVGTVVATITASDPDIGPEGEVVYTIEEDDSDGAFKIDRLSGTIRTSKPLDFEERQIHTLTITAADLGAPPLSSRAHVTVHVVDVNENLHAPLFQELVVQGSVPENAPTGTSVLQVTATDQDPSGEDNRIGYSIKGGDGIGLFSIDNKGWIRTLATLDVETKAHYWLTVVAQDHGVIPLRSSIQVYIKVENENDNVPLSVDPVYYPTVPEDSPGGYQVVQIRATDADLDPNQSLSYRIVSGNPEGYFSINTTSGYITTTSRRLDREHQDELILEVMISDDSHPPLSSTTRVVVKVEDINDHAPEFEQQFYKVQIPAALDVDTPLFQNESILSEIDLYDGAIENATWQTFGAATLTGDRILRVLAYDKDDGSNAEITYSIKPGRKIKFKIHNTTGVIYAQKGFEPGQQYELYIRATDGGTPSRSNICRVSVNVVGVPSQSLHIPQVKPLAPVKVTESDRVGFLVALVQAQDGDNDTLWYDIIDGDPRDEFYIGRDNGNILLARQLDWELQNEYLLNISVTDGVNIVYTQLNVTVIDINDHRPEFTQSMYHVDISEAVMIGTEILKLEATDRDSEGKLIYSLHAAQHEQSLRTFKLDSMSGAITLAAALDRETIAIHLLTVMVRDGGTPAQRNYARVVVTVHDHNDHTPQFSEQILEGKVYENAALGSVVLTALAIDRDKGENARVTYSITSGNVGNVFTINPRMGTIHVSRELDLASAPEYTLYVRATDHGNPPLSSTVPAHIMVTMSDNAEPKFTQKDLSAEIYEDRPVGSYVTHLEVRSTSSVQYEITEGNVDDAFLISPSTGVIVTQKILDYETTRFYNLTVTARNMASASATSNVIIHILDRNDNAPEFLHFYYEGSVSEAAPVNSLVLTNRSTPLVINASDADSELNALMNFEIVEALPKKYFHIDSSTGAVRTVRLLDHEMYDKFIFHVKLTDRGKPRLSSESTAKVQITVNDINDCAPRFTHQVYNVTLLLPTYKNVAVIQLNATDPDSEASTTLRYDIIEGNKHEVFAIDSERGIITVLDPEDMKSMHRLQVRVSDGKFSNIAKVNVKVEQSEHSGLMFQKKLYEASVTENSTKITTVCVVNVLGSALNEHVEFTILNPTDMFEIGLTSGAIRSTGKRFDREAIDSYELIVEARSHMPGRDRPRVAHVIVNVTVFDINDNCPMFVNLPYYAVVSVDDPKGSVITKVHAVDMDQGENGEVRYELIRGHGELFKVLRKTGDIELKQSLEGHNKEYELLIAAYDGGITPCRTDVTVHVKVIDRSMPVFKKQFYSETVPESVELHSPLALSVEAESPLGRKLIYSIVKGNELEEFALDFNTAPDSKNGPCVISVVDELDYEQQQQYELLIRATDSVSGIYAEVPVSVAVQDVNDCPPEFLQDSYNVSVSEAAPFGTAVLKVMVKDNDTGINQKVVFSIQTDPSNSSEFFHIDAADGTIYLKQSLDHEQASSHHFIVVATDQGVPSLSSTAHVWLTVLDMNDNPPRFEQLSYSCGLSVHATRGQFVTVVTASDPDQVDLHRLRYAIVAGNEQQTFSIGQDTGVVTLMNLGNFGTERTSTLNISVSDGVYTNFARLKVDLLPANLHSPVFTTPFMEAAVAENKPSGQYVTTVKATDEDFGEFSTVVYSIHSSFLNEKFNIDKVSGKIATSTRLDREYQKSYELPIMATDVGGRSGFMTVRVKILDENDNTPQFLLKEYKASIHSNYSVGMPFLKIKASDADEGPGAQVEYSIYETQSSGVLELFAINPTTGGVFLLKSAIPWESQVFQFFVRARDGGKPALYADVPVNVLIMAPTDQPPIFEKRDDKFFFPENSQPGTVITKLKMVSNVSVTYRIVSENPDDRPQFVIDDQAQLCLAAPLDFEIKESHLIGILAETDASPPLSALAEVTVQVLDENDHAPQFESNPYTIYVAENIDEGTSILKVIAHDEDQGSNGEVRYSFSSDVGDAANVFSIDAHTGWITNLVSLDKEERPEYKFHVMAMDNGHSKHTARTTVIVRLKDYNDKPSLFKRKVYEAAVNEDALPGTVILQLEITDEDADLKTPVAYYISGGDPRSQFQIRQTGEVYVSKPLDRETESFYNLVVVVTDGIFTDTTKVNIDILDANDNPPYCLRHRYRNVLSEGVHPGTYVLTVQAADLDDSEHSKLRYVLTGEGSEHFQLDKDYGHLKTIKPLDREAISKFSLTAYVQDREHSGWECSSRIEIVVSDLNDNAPLFSLPYYSVTLPEDVEVGTLVTKVHATDSDIGINRKIKYAFLDSSNNHFKMSPDSGIVTLAKPLDREQKASYNLTVQAVDQGTPQMSSVATLIVNVQDINDNPPEFASKYYFAVVPEIDAINTDVIRVLATSKDTGVNADIYYSIVGGNEHKKFKIDNRTGVISIAEMLDYERAKDYFLTIQATDGGSPPLSNRANVNITVTDSNDNAPVFMQVSYSARIPEDAELGDKIIQVTANDLDSGDNGRVTYSIENGNRQTHFAIDPDNGYIAVSDQLDRESISSYVLEVLAKDNGLPVLSRSVLVNIEISDTNDNPPLFSQSNYTTIVQEDKPLGYPILKFTVTDADAPPNGAPYTFDFRSGNDGGIFRLEQDGILRTATKFNHRVKDIYLLNIRVFDNGTRPLYSDTWVVVKVIEESQYPPVTHPLEISINSFLDEYSGGVIGKVHSIDQDQYDTLTYSLSPTIGIPYPIAELFQIDRTDGTLRALPRLDVGDYRLNVSVTDGKYYTHTIVKVTIEVITEEMLDNSVVVRFREVTPEVFILSHRKGFVRAVRSAMNSRLKDVVIISVQPSNDDVNLINHGLRSRSARQVVSRDLDVLFTIRKPQIGAFYSTDAIRKALNENLEELEESTKLVVEEIVRMKCTQSYCMSGVCQDRIILDVDDITPISTDVTSFVSPKHQHRMDCICKEGYAGDRCETVVNECAREPCPVFKICVPDASVQGYTCQCPEGFAGASCDIDISKCHDESCYIPRNPVSFSGKSYAQYRIIDKRSIEQQQTLSLRVRTMHPTGNLMYAAGRVDYNVLEVVNGAVQYRFDLGSGEGIVRVSSVYVSDGRWHEIRLERDKHSARLTVDNIHVAHGSAPGISDILNLQNDNMYFGAEVHQHPSILGFEDIQRGFSGCMDDVRMSRVSVPLHMSGDSSIAVLMRFANVEFSCDVTSVLVPPGPCGSQPCMNGGTCLETSGGYECQCHARFKGLLCELDTDPCQSQPCLFGGKCSTTGAGDYHCECLPKLSGKRCEYGRHCVPNPCRHGGVCEEGDDGPLCQCRGYTGDVCEFDVNECESSPCFAGSTCINEVGSYRCVCPTNMTGRTCSILLSQPASFLNISLMELSVIIGGVTGIILLIIFIFIIRKCCMRRRRDRARIINETRKEPVLLNSARPHELTELKRSSKLSNLEVNRRDAPVMPPRPVSYTPSSHNEPTYNCNSVVLNNLDTLRSYGSAGDELENVPPDYLRNLNRTAAPVANHCGSETDTMHKPTWAEQMHLATMGEANKIKNDLKLTSPVLSEHNSRMLHNTMRNYSSGRSNDEDPRMLGVLGPMDSSRDIETLNEDLESEYVADSECEPCPSSPRSIGTTGLNALDSAGGGPAEDAYTFTTAENYLRHPNTYLPPHAYNIPSCSSEAEAEPCLNRNPHSPPDDSDNEVEPYGFPSSHRNRNRRRNRNNDIGSILLDERHSLLGLCASNSDISTNVCDIEDSECETEHKPLNCIGGTHTTPGGVHQTAV